MQLSSCMENGQLRQAQEYIQKIYSEIETNKVIVFCENEAANLIFSAFAKRAEDTGALDTAGCGLSIQGDCGSFRAAVSNFTKKYATLKADW